MAFNRELAMDLCFLDGKAVLHIVDTATHFVSAACLSVQSVEHVCQTFISCCLCLYVGYPNNIRTDQGSVFTSSR